MQKSILTAPPLLPRVAPADKADALDANAVAALAAAQAVVVHVEQPRPVVHRPGVRRGSLGQQRRGQRRLFRRRGRAFLRRRAARQRQQQNQKEQQVSPHTRHLPIFSKFHHL